MNERMNKTGFRILALMLMMLFALPMAANATSSDREIKNMIEHSLNPFKDLDVKVDKGEVTLKGEVATSGQRAEALAKAGSVAGVRNVKDEIRVTGGDDSQTVGEYLDDSGITAKIKADLLAHSGLDSKDVGVQTNDGVVMLTGSVKDSNEISMAESVAMKVKGVKSVDNRLSVKR